MGFPQRGTIFELRLKDPHSLDLCNLIKGLNVFAVCPKEPLYYDRMFYYMLRVLKVHTPEGYWLRCVLLLTFLFKGKGEYMKKDL